MKSAPYGSWQSPVTAEFVSGKDRTLSPSIQVDGDSIFFIESRPDEGGRSVLMCRGGDGDVREVLPGTFNVRTRYLEYGGLAFLARRGTCYFVNFADQEIYVAKPNEVPRRLTNENGHRFADLTFDEARNRLIALREAPATPESKNTICAIDLESGRVEDLVSGADFYNCARVQGDRLLWISWNHPNMPWNGSELWTANLSDLARSKLIAGDSEHAISQAQWGPQGEIYFAGELTDFVNIYRWHNGKIENVFPREADFTLPDWVPGMRHFAVAMTGVVCAGFLENGRWKIIQRRADSLARVFETPLAAWNGVQPRGVDFIALVDHAERPAALTLIRADGHLTELYAPKRSELAKEFISVAREFRYQTVDGPTGYAWYYPPTNGSFVGTEDEKPPLVVCAHGGPTVLSPASFRKEFQFWTSRGYAVVDVNYGGSAGFGRHYRERLRGNWGVTDVNDCVSAVQALAAEGLIDPARVAIRGGSAGGYTTLAALTFTKGTFAVGASYYGVSELELLAKETHKFESRYCDQLVGPYPEALAIYKERAPLEHVERLSCPVVFFQGDEDKIVPPNQSELMYESLRKKGVPTEYHLYAKEGHGFRRAETTQHALKTEHGFYARVFGFSVQDGDRAQT